MQTHLDLRIRIPNHDVRVKPDLQPPLPVREARVLRRPDTQPLHDAPDREPALPRLRPQEAQAEAERADPAPRAHDIARINVLQRRYTRAVVAHDTVDRTLFQGFPEFLSVVSLADGWTAFELRVTIWDVF